MKYKDSNIPSISFQANLSLQVIKHYIKAAVMPGVFSFSNGIKQTSLLGIFLIDRR